MCAIDGRDSGNLLRQHRPPGPEALPAFIFRARLKLNQRAGLPEDPEKRPSEPDARLGDLHVAVVATQRTLQNMLLLRGGHALQSPLSEMLDGRVEPRSRLPSAAGFRIFRAVSDRIVHVEKLRKTFGGNEAVAGLDFEVRRGEIVGLLGPNGAGKTTAIHILLGLTTATSGTVEIFGLDHDKNRRAILRRCNFSSAYTNLPANLRVWENLRVSSLMYDVPDAARKADELMELFEISHLRDRISGHLSSGEATRLNLCKSLLNDPELLLLDEPTASLDPDIADKVRKILRRLQKERGISMIYTSHNMRDVEEVCDRVYFINHGKVIAQGTPAEVVQQFHENSLEDVFINVARGGELVSEAAKQSDPT